jgi:hypothetical protein
LKTNALMPALVTVQLRTVQSWSGAATFSALRTCAKVTPSNVIP